MLGSGLGGVGADTDRRNIDMQNRGENKTSAPTRTKIGLKLRGLQNIHTHILA